ncbi:MAG: acylphosphatase [Ignavibacteriaceae bacterium]
MQGVGFRYFVYRHATELGLKGYVRNLYNGNVLTVVEGDSSLIEELIKQIRIGPSHASVKDVKINWVDYKNEFNNFEIRH